MTKEEDDLYADLYSEDVAGSGDKSGSQGGAEESIYEEEVKPKGMLNRGTPSAATGRSSFIPAAAPSSSSGSSFIPADPNRSSFIPPVRATPTARATTAAADSTRPTSNAAPGSRIETAPMTNADGASHSPAPYSGDSSSKQLLPHEMPDEGKLFVGGLNWETTDDGLKHYFSQFGKVNYCLVMRDPGTQRSRGFAFLTFDDPKAVNSVMVKEHFLDGKIIDPKRAIPRQDNVKTAKCFIGGIPSTATSDSFKAFFQQYGNVLDSTLMMDRETQKPRGYGFVTYDNDSTVEKLLSIDGLTMDGKLIEVKRASPRNADGTKKVMSSRTDSMPERGSTGGTGAASTSSAAVNVMDPSMFMQTGGGAQNPMATAAMMMGGGGNGMFGTSAAQQPGFDPQMMAQFFQQQNWGNANFNPMAFQQMMMGGMGGMGGMMGMGGMGGMGGMAGMGGWGGGGSPFMGGMNMGGMSPSGTTSYTESNAPTSMRARGAGAGASMRSSASQERSSSATPASRGRSNLQAPISAGLPNRPNTQGSSSPNTGRDYSREKSPERRGGGGAYNRDSRW